MRKAFLLGSTLTLAGLLVCSGYGWAADMGTSGGTTSDMSKSKDSAKKKSEKSSSSDMSSSDKGMKGGGGNENVKKAQEALKDKGQDAGPIDGVMGPKTRAAIKAYQSANKMKPTGRLDAETAKSLGVEAAAGSSSAGSSSMEKDSSKSSSKDSSKSASKGLSGTSDTPTADKGTSAATKGSSGSSSFGDRPSGRNAPSSRDSSGTGSSTK